MNAPKNQEPKPVQQPFFVRFLEQQQALAVQTDVKAGRPNYTLKYPSDSDEGSTSEPLRAQLNWPAELAS